MVQKFEYTIGNIERKQIFLDEEPISINNAAILQLPLLYFQLSLLGTILQIYKSAGLLGQVREVPW